MKAAIEQFQASYMDYLDSLVFYGNAHDRYQGLDYVSAVEEFWRDSTMCHTGLIFLGRGTSYGWFFPLV